MSTTATISFQELRQFPDLLTLSEDSLHALSQVLLPIKVEVGEVLHPYSGTEKYYFLLRTGSIEIKTKMLGLEVLLRTVEARESFGQGALVGSGKNLSFIAKEPSTLFVLPSYTHALAIEQGAQWALSLQKTICFQVVQQMRATLKQLRSLATAEQERISEYNEKDLLDILKRTEISTGRIHE